MKFDQIREWVFKNSRRVMLGGVGLVLIGAGVFWWKSGLTSGEEGVKILGAEEVSTEIGMTEVIVDVSGAVVRPGVYTLKGEERVNNALDAAGGLATDADIKWVETNLNRSARLTDGMKIYIPRLGGEKVQDSRVKIQGGKVNINAASVAELDKLPGIGEVTAGKIISGRPYTQTEELLQRKVVTQKVWEQIKDMVSTW